jgi:hypothetical protein
MTRPRICRECKTRFTPARPLQVVCSPLCALAQARAQSVKAIAARDRERAQALKTHRDLIREAQAAFNAYIRLRDRALPCISCGRTDRQHWDAGHYLTTGARPELRFDEANVHKQCVPCNQHLSGNLIAYRKGLIERMGLDVVERLEGPHAPAKWSREELIALRQTYMAKVRELRKGLE